VQLTAAESTANPEVLKRNQEALEEKRLRDNEIRKKAWVQAELDRKERAYDDKLNPPKDSVGKELKFGANMVKFEPPAQARGG